MNEVLSLDVGLYSAYKRYICRGRRYKKRSLIALKRSILLATTLATTLATSYKKALAN